jgi:hypothetical protein
MDRTLDIEGPISGSKGHIRTMKGGREAMS